MTVSAADHVTSTVSVVITAQETTIHNFNLRSTEPCISVAPLSMTATLMPGASQTQILTLTNAGAAASLFRFREADGGLALMKPGVDAPLSLITSGGPDTFGYTYKDSTESGGPIYDWVDISATGTPVYLYDDDGDGPFPIGFAFNFYGNDYTRLYVSSNGYLSFNSLDLTDLSNDCPLPDVYDPNDGIYLMWDDLNPGYYGDPVYYQAFTDCPYGGGQACLVVQYENFHHYGASGVAGTFEAILFENGSILIQFEDAGLEQGSSSTTGIENEDGTIGLTYACDTGASLSDDLAVCFGLPGPAGRLPLRRCPLALHRTGQRYSGSRRQPGGNCHPCCSAYHEHRRLHRHAGDSNRRCRQSPLLHPYDADGTEFLAAVHAGRTQELLIGQVRHSSTQ